jgi:dual specificity tyrosine-phosphorylation-regulated kinase 1
LYNQYPLNPTTSLHNQATEIIGPRPPADRPVIKLSKYLIDTYKYINIIYEQEQEEKRRAKAERRKPRNKTERPIPSGARNHGWDDENYDYILTPNELINDRYKVQERLGKGSFGQVVRAIDTVKNVDVAIKIIKSKKPFQVQARTEIEILTHLRNRDPEDEHNIVRLLTYFMYKNHQCLVFEMLSFNLYELLKNTQFVGVSLHLIRKFARQILSSLQFLARSDVDVIHCDLKPENILLRHPKRSGVKVIDFGSSCRSNRRMYPYIQSRFYRSPEVLLGLPYTVAIDMWSLGCILFEMHTGEPLFSGSDQFDQMQKIVKILGMIPDEMLERIEDEQRIQFFEKDFRNRWTIKQKEDNSSIVTPSINPKASLIKILENKINANQQAAASYEMFVDLIFKMLAYNPEARISPEECMLHPFITTELGSRQNPTS